MTDPAALSSALIGEIFVERGHITADQLEEALAAQAETGELLGEILVSRFGVPRVELAGVLAEQWAMMERSEALTSEAVSTPYVPVANGVHAAPADPADVDVERRPIGEIFVEHGVVTQSQVDAAVIAQGESGQRLGEVLVAQGAITRLELASALAEQWSTLQKIRPPEPRAPEPWQDAAVRAAAADGGPDQIPLAAPPADVEHLRDAVKALEERLRTVSATASPSPPDEKLREISAGLTARIDELEERVQAAASPELEDLRVSIDEIRASLDEFRARLDAPNESVVELEQRLDTTVEGLLARIETLHQGSVDDAALGGLLDSVAGLQQQAGDLVARDEVDAIRVALGAVSEQVKEVATRASGITHEDLDRQIGMAVTELRERLDTAAPQRDDEAISELRDAIAGLEARLGELTNPDPDLTSGAVVDEIRGRLDGLATQVDRAQQDSSDRLGEVIGAEQTERRALAGSIEEAIGRLNGLDELRARVEALASPNDVVRDALKPVEDRLAALADRVDEVGEVAHAQPPAPAFEEIERLSASLTDLGARLREVASRPAGVSQDQLERRLADVTAGLLSQTSTDAVTVAGADELASIQEAVAGLGLRFADVASADAFTGLDAAVAELGSRVDDLSATVGEAARTLELHDGPTKDHVDALVAAEREAREELAGRVNELAAAPLTDEQARTELAELRQRVSELGAPQVEESALDELRQQVSELAEQPSQEAALEELRQRVAELGERSGNVDALAALERSLIERHEIEAAARGSLETQLADVRNGLHGLDELRAQLEALASERHDVVHQGDLGDFSHRLAEVGGRLDGLASAEWVTSLERTASEASHALGERLEGLELRLAGADRSAELEQLHALVADLQSRLGGVDAVVLELRGGIEATVANALREGLAQTVAPEALAQLTADLDARLAEVEAANAPTRTALDELGMRLGATEHQAWALPEQLDGRFASLHHELSGRIDGIGAAYDSALAALHARLDELAGGRGAEVERLSGLEHAAASVNVRLEGLEARHAQDGTVGDQIAVLTARLDTELLLAEERGTAIERAIRKGLAGLGERLTANEEAYHASGAALRRSLERLGAAVVEADTRIADMPLDPPEYGYVAFVPTADGYRLRPLEGGVPVVGEVIELDEASGSLRVARVARSPLPLDRRACAYLERV